jgi:hypothetical protein
VKDLVRIRSPDADAGQAFALKSSGAKAIDRIVLFWPQCYTWPCRAVSLHYDIASLEEDSTFVVVTDT